MPKYPYGRPVIPSKRPSEERPYSPKVNISQTGRKPLQAAQPYGIPAMGSFVLSTFDTLPVNGINFYREFGGRDQAGASGDVRGGFVIPQGRRLLLRYLVLGVIVDAPILTLQGFGRNLNSIPIGTVAFSDPDVEIDALVYYTVTVNGSPIQDHADVPLFNLWSPPRIIPLHQIVEQGDEIGIYVRYNPIEEDYEGNMWVYGAFAGNHLADRGEALQVSPANNYAVPVQSGTFEGL